MACRIDCLTFINHPPESTLPSYAGQCRLYLPTLLLDLTVGYQSVLEGVGHSLRPAVYLELLKDVLDVVAGC